MASTQATSALPLPKLSGGRFVCSGEDGDAHNGSAEGCFIPALTDEDLFRATGVRIAFTSKKGGVSAGPYASLNLGSHVDDNPDCVRVNRKRVADCFDADAQAIIVPNQVHGTDIVPFGFSESFDAQDDEMMRKRASLGADGVACNRDCVPVMLCFADCLPVIVVAPSGAFCVAHAGWRGAVGGIAAAAVTALAEDPHQCNVYIGPYIHAECFEVGEEVAQKFRDAFGADCLMDDNHVDLGAAVRCQVIRAGVDPSRIADADICTVCNADTYFSYRASGGVCGRHAACAVKVPKEKVKLLCL